MCCQAPWRLHSASESDAALSERCLSGVLTSQLWQVSFFCAVVDDTDIIHVRFLNPTSNTHRYTWDEPTGVLHCSLQWCWGGAPWWSAAYSSRVAYFISTTQEAQTELCLSLSPGLLLDQLLFKAYWWTTTFFFFFITFILLKMSDETFLFPDFHSDWKDFII